MRTAVRRFLAGTAAAEHLAQGELAIAVSGGPDSLALAALAVPLAAERGTRAVGLVVDHQLQPGSARVAARAAEQLTEMGAQSRVLTVTVTGRGGMEAAARRARYAALREAVRPGSLVMLGHTRDDQAETVLLGLGRGSGPRSIAGMRPLEPPWARPLLAVSRAQTVGTCAALGLPTWSDPQNADDRFTRVRLRKEVLPLLEEVLAGGVSAALARTAAQMREDLEVLDSLAAELLVCAESGSCSKEEHKSHFQQPHLHKSHFQQTLAVGVLEPAPAALRRRALRRWLLAAGVGDLTAAQIGAVDALIWAWHGQGAVWVHGGLAVRRAHGRLWLDSSTRPHSAR